MDGSQFLMPLHPSEFEDRGTDAGDDRRPPRLVAIDDSQLIHRLLKARLRREHIEIHCATNGTDGLEMIRALTPDVILMDIDMPGMSGWEVLEELKSDTTTHDIPVLFVSASTTVEDKVRAFESGAVDFVSKPFEPTELRARVRAAIRMQTMIKMLAKRAKLDGLTGLWNRTYFDEKLELMFEESVLASQPFSLILCDLDHFKSLNDTYGHPFGDRVLETFAEILSSGRHGDIACRYGGEEFAVILPNTTSADAEQIAQRMRDRIRMQMWDGVAQERITASFGIAERTDVSASSREELLQAADAALYDAKNSGRDRVLTSGSTPGDQPGHTDDQRRIA